MSEKNKVELIGERVDFSWKVIRAIVGICALLGVAWVQFIGPGVKSSFRDFVGITEIVDRLSFVERFMPPPKVVDWNQSNSQQLGECFPTITCLYILTGSRTAYGERCGRPTSATPEIRTSYGTTVQIAYDGFKPIELTRSERSFSVPLKLNGLVEPGRHQWRTKITYPSCPGINEPIPRYTPWFPITITPRAIP